LKSSAYDVHSLIREIDRTIRRYISKKTPATLYEPVQYLFQSGGKRLRALLLTLAGGLIGKNYRRCFEAAAAVEMLHNFSLIHDDIMDHDDLRRGRETIHKKWNANVAILSGDLLAALSFRALSQCPEKYAETVGGLFSDGFVALCEGQALDKEFETRADVREKDYLRMIALKTAALFGMAAQVGAVLGGGNTKQQNALKAFGLDFGMAFQIQDDLLDIIADETVLGKDVGSDLIEKKKTYISILAAGDPKGMDLLAQFQSVRNAAEQRLVLGEFKQFLDRSGIRKKTEKKIDRYIRTALSRLNGFKNNSAKEQLIAITHRMWKRRN
jgi:geranylgeranyl diphosphate synthase type II